MGQLTATQEWALVLDQLEMLVIEAELTARNPSSSDRRRSLTTWVEPTMTTTIPAELVERARELLRRQQETCRLLSERATALRAEAGRARSATRHAAAASLPSAYLDVNA